MTKKRLTRELKWGFQYFPYHQLWMDNDIFTGWVAINDLTDGEYYYWDFPKAGKVPVAGKDIIIDDRDELDAAFQSGELSREQYEKAIIEGEDIINELGTDIVATERWCCDILQKAEANIQRNPFTIFLDIDGVLDIFNPSVYYQELIPEAVERLAKLIHRTKANVVVISDWRYGSKECEKSNKLLQDNWRMLQEKLAANNVRICGVTTCESKYKNRTEEIKAYLSEHTEIKRYAILDDFYSDDYSSDEEIKRHLVFVDAFKALQDEDCIQVCKLMNKMI